MRSALLATALLASCASAGGARPAPASEAPAVEEVPAVIVEPTPQSRAALLQAVTDVLGLQPLIAPDALTRESTLAIERRHFEGRERDLPERFRLFQAGSRCILVHERTGHRSLLVGTRCTPSSRTP